MILFNQIKQDEDSYEPDSIIFGLSDGYYVAPKQNEVCTNIFLLNTILMYIQDHVIIYINFMLFVICKFKLSYIYCIIIKMTNYDISAVCCFLLILQDMKESKTNIKSGLLKVDQELVSETHFTLTLIYKFSCIYALPDYLQFKFL